MNNIDKEDKGLITLNAPRSNCVWFLQTLSLSPFGTALMIIWVFFNSNSYHSFAEILPFMAILLAAGFLLIYIPQTYMTRIIFDRKKRSLTKMSKGHKPITIDLSEAQQIISAGEYTSPGVKYSMVILDKKGESLVIFNEDVMRNKPWIAFSGKISKMTGVPLKEEHWAQDFNGKRHLLSNEKFAHDKKRNYALALVPFFIAFLFALLFKIRPTSTNFLLAGIVSVVVNVGLSFAYLFQHRDNMGHFGKSKLLLSMYVLSFSIPYFFFYFIIAFVLNRFYIPFGN